jgi:membrane protein
MHVISKYYTMKLKSAANKTGYMLKETFSEFVADNGIQLSAALSYYTFFSLVPLLVIIINMFGFIFGKVAIRGEIYGEVKGLMGDKAALQIQEVIKNASLSNSSTLITVIGIIVLILGASGVFSEIQDSLNYIWGIKTKPKHTLIKFIKNRLSAFSMIGSVGFLLLVGLVVNSLVDILNKSLALYFPPKIITLFYTANILIIFLTITILFTLIFKILPDGKVVMSHCIIGASFTAVLFMVGKFIIGAYLIRSSVASIYGAAGTVILVLLWVYYSAIILYFGAEFTKVYTRSHGEKIIPNEHSVRLKPR